MNQFESREDYLERILMLSESGEQVRAIDIARSMGFSKPSVSIALKKLKADGHILVDDANGYISLTESGKEIASRVFERHQVLTSVLVAIGVDEKIAREDACKIEHDLSPETFEAIKKHVSK